MIKRIACFIVVLAVFLAPPFSALAENPSVVQLTVTIDGAAPPPPPAGLTAVAGDEVVDLSWDPVSGVAGYNVYRSQAYGGGYTLLNPSPLAEEAYQDTDVGNGTTYYYVVTSVNHNGQESSYSQEVSATPHSSGGDLTIMVDAYPETFSPNNDGVKEGVNIFADIFDIMEPAAVDWTVVITDWSGLAVRTFYEWTYDEAGVHQIIIWWDGTDEQGFVVPEGGYTIEVYAVSGGFSGGPEVAFVEVDTEPPDIFIDVPVSAGGYTNEDVTPLIDVFDTNFDLRVDITLNSQPFVNGTTITDEGSYELEVYAEDGAGNISSDAASFTIDKTPPEILTSYPVDGSLVAAGGYANIWMNIVFHDALSGVDTSLIRLTDKTGRDITLYSIVTPNSVGYDIQHPGSDQYKFTLHLEDLAGNAGDSEISFVTDSSVPEVTASVKGGQYSRPFTVDLLCSEDAVIYYSTDGYPPLEGADNTTAVAGTSASVCVESTTNLRFYAVDEAGNQSETKSQIYLFNELPPPVSGLTTAYSDTDNRVELQWARASSARSYNIYRAVNVQEVGALRQSGQGNYAPPRQLKINSAEVSGLSYYDDSVSPGITYWYAVSVVDRDGVEGPVCEPVSLEIPLLNGAADAQAAIQRSLVWVESNQSAAGCWGAEEEKRILSTSQILNALSLKGINNLWVTRGLFYLRGRHADNNDYIARSVLSLERFNHEVDWAVARLISQAYFQNNYIYGWGVQRRYQYDALTTALGRLVINKRIPSADKTDYALLNIPPEEEGSLQSKQGYYGWVPRQDTSIFVSALVYYALGSGSGSYQWIIDSQAPDGSFGTGIIDTAGVLLWIPLEDTARTAAVNYLVSRQEPNGSWNNNDAYVTGLCLEALIRNEN